MKSDGAELLRHWPAKALAGLLLGFVIALFASGLLAWAGPGGLDAPGKYRVVMWAVLPVSLLILTFSFLFRTGWRAWAWLGAAALLLRGALSLCQAWL